MGVKFQREDWLGGYSAFRRRMVRLAHVALVALGICHTRLAGSGGGKLPMGRDTPTAEGLDGLELRSNWKYRKKDFYRAAIARIQSQGITLNGCFVLGLDGDTEEVFDVIPRFVEETALYDVQVTVQTPFPGTPLYQRLLYSGRLIQPRNGCKCALFDVNFHPPHITPERLEPRLRELAVELYHEEAVIRRHRRFFRVYGERFREARLQPCEA